MKYFTGLIGRWAGPPQAQLLFPWKPTGFPPSRCLGRLPIWASSTTSFSGIQGFSNLSFFGSSLCLQPLLSFFRDLGLFLNFSSSQTGLHSFCSSSQASLASLALGLAGPTRPFPTLFCCSSHIWRTQDWLCMDRLHPFPQHYEALSTIPGTGEAVSPTPPLSGFSLAGSHGSMNLRRLRVKWPGKSTWPPW